LRERARVRGTPEITFGYQDNKSKKLLRLMEKDFLAEITFEVAGMEEKGGFL
jgi:hypothetical protein